MHWVMKVKKEPAIEGAESGDLQHQADARSKHLWITDGIGKPEEATDLHGW